VARCVHQATTTAPSSKAASLISGHLLSCQAQNTHIMSTLLHLLDHLFKCLAYTSFDDCKNYDKCLEEEGKYYWLGFCCAVLVILILFFIQDKRHIPITATTSKILKQRRLCVNVLTENDLAYLKPLCSEIRSHPSLVEFVIAIHPHLQLKPEDQATIDAIGQAIADNPRLTNVTVQHNRYKPPPFSISTLCAILQRPSPIQMIKFVDCRFPSELCRALVPVLSASTVVQVYLDKCYFQRDGMGSIFVGLRLAPALSGLCFSFDTNLLVQEATALYILLSTKKLDMFHYRSLWSSPGFLEYGTCACLLLLEKGIAVKTFKADVQLSRYYGNCDHRTDFEQVLERTLQHAPATRGYPSIPLESLDLSQSSVSLPYLREILGGLKKASALKVLKIGNLSLHSAFSQTVSPKDAFSTVRLLLELVIRCESLIDLEMPYCLSVAELRSAATPTKQRARTKAIENRQAIAAICAAKTKSDIVEQLVFHRDCLGVLSEVLSLCDMTVLLEDLVSIQRQECSDDGETDLFE